MLEQTVQIVSNERDTDSYFRLVMRAPRIAPLIQPGQFAHVRVLPLKDALLRRPFSIFQVSVLAAYDRSYHREILPVDEFHTGFPAFREAFYQPFI